MTVGNRVLVILVAMLGVCVALAATNPTSTQYGRFLDTQLTKALARMDPQDSTVQQQIMREILTSQGKKVIDSLIRSNTAQRNYGLFSVFTTRVLHVEVVVIGVGTQFIPLDSEEALRKKLGRVMF